MPTEKLPKAPRGLGAAGRQLWRRAVSEFVFNVAEQAVLEQACRSADVIAKLHDAWVDADAVVAGSRGQPACHPLIRELREERALLARLLEQVGIGAASSNWDGLTASQRARKAARARWH